MEQIWTSWDRFCSHHFRHALARVGFVDLLKPPSSVTADLPFVASPTPLVTSVLGYLTIVLLGLIVNCFKPPKKRSDGPVLRAVVQAHNLVLILLSGYMCFSAINEAFKNSYNLWGNPFKPSQKGLANVIYIFYISKLYEFCDTFIMLVKGNVKQVTFLHVYHHASISTIWWAITYVAPGGDAYYSVAFNSLVHVVMYTYYFMASAIGKDEKTRRTWLWWGPYLTMFQMFQFLTMMIQAAYCWLIDRQYNVFLSKLLFFYMMTLLALFGNFYVQKYLSRKSAAAKRKPE